MTTNTISKITGYEVNADGNRSYSSTRKASVMSVFKTWKKQGCNPQAFVIGLDAEEKIVCEKIAE